MLMLRWLQAPASLLESSSRSAGSQYGSYWCPGLQQFAMCLHLDCIRLTPGFVSWYYMVLLLPGTSAEARLSGVQTTARLGLIHWMGNGEIGKCLEAQARWKLVAFLQVMMAGNCAAEVVVATKSFSQFSQVNRTSMLNQVVCTGCRDCCWYLLFFISAHGIRVRGSFTASLEMGQGMSGNDKDYLVTLVTRILCEPSCDTCMRCPISCECPSEILLRVLVSTAIKADFDP